MVKFKYVLLLLTILVLSGCGKKELENITDGTGAVVGKIDTDKTTNFSKSEDMYVLTVDKDTFAYTYVEGSYNTATSIYKDSVSKIDNMTLVTSNDIEILFTKEDTKLFDDALKRLTIITDSSVNIKDDIKSSSSTSEPVNQQETSKIIMYIDDFNVEVDISKAVAVKDGSNISIENSIDEIKADMSPATSAVADLCFNSLLINLTGGMYINVHSGQSASYDGETITVSDTDNTVIKLNDNLYGVYINSKDIQYELWVTGELESLDDKLYSINSLFTRKEKTGTSSVKEEEIDTTETYINEESKDLNETEMTTVQQPTTDVNKEIIYSFGLGGVSPVN